MKRNAFLISGVSLLLTSVIYACPVKNQKQLNTISYQTSAESIVKVQKAKVIVTLNITLDPQKVGSLKTNSIDKLENIVPNSEWSVEDYTQNKTSSGLLNVNISFKSRLDAQQVAKLNSLISSLNGSGRNFTVSAVSYTPSLNNIEQTKNQLRIKMYDMINQQVQQLNNQAHTHYQIGKIIFSTNNSAPRPVPYTMSYVAKAKSNNASADTFKVSQKIIMKADVELQQSQEKVKP